MLHEERAYFILVSKQTSVFNLYTWFSDCVLGRSVHIVLSWENLYYSARIVLHLSI